MKAIFIKSLSFSVVSLVLLDATIAAENNEASVDVHSESDSVVIIDELNQHPLLTAKLSGPNSNLVPKFFGASELRSTRTQSSLSADVGVQLGSVHHLYFRGQRVNRNNSTPIDKYRVSYRLNIRDQTSILMNSTNIDYGSGNTRTDFAVGIRQVFPTKSVNSSFNFGYKNAEDSFTQVEARYNVAKKLRSFPLRLSSNIKYRQREFSAGDVVGSVGGAVGLHYNIQPRLSVALTHNIKDDLSAERTSLTGSFSKNFGSNTVTFKMGAATEQAAFFRVQSLLNI